MFLKWIGWRYTKVEVGEKVEEFFLPTLAEFRTNADLTVGTVPLATSS
jgi:hypothetical protein